MFFQYCPQAYYSHAQEITDIGCRLAGHVCGTNMRFVPMEVFKDINNQSHIIGCILQCTCEENFEYFVKNGQCMKKVHFFFLTIIKIRWMFCKLVKISEFDKEYKKFWEKAAFFQNFLKYSWRILFIWNYF